MAKINGLLVVSTVLFLSTCVPFSRSLRTEDVPYIKCQVCEKMASQLYQQVETKQEQISPIKITELQIIQIAENICNLKKEEADWIQKIDIVEEGDKLELVDQDALGHCGTSECKTIEKACLEMRISVFLSQVLGYSDTDIAEYIYKFKPDIDSLSDHLCHHLTDSCTNPPPPVPEDRVPGEAFVAKTAQELYTDKIMKSMGGLPSETPPGMKVITEEELQEYKKKMKASGNKDGGEEADSSSSSSENRNTKGEL